MDVQETATAISAVSTAIAIILALWKWTTALKQQTRASIEQTRRVRLETARLAWDLANMLHEEPIAGNALELLDGEASEVVTPQHGTHKVTPEEVQALLASKLPGSTNERLAAVRYAFDSMFYALDRLRSAMSAGLITDADLSSPTLYYCRKLATTHGFVLDYGVRAGYSTTVAFVRALGATSDGKNRP